MPFFFSSLINEKQIKTLFKNEQHKSCDKRKEETYINVTLIKSMTNVNAYGLVFPQHLKA